MQFLKARVTEDLSGLLLDHMVDEFRLFYKMLGPKITKSDNIVLSGSLFIGQGCRRLDDYPYLWSLLRASGVSCAVQASPGEESP